ncbi:hypothetical protein B0H10DRAFT_1773020 [Mycena sp. CBHHK59/15]|nr:hypothetical protein B0H10DRAFT_1773020 [Mycena sp. CBHHK59/15]
MTAGDVFTDYHAQGRTIPYVLVDIVSPPSGKLNLFNLYVPLSQSSGQQTIQLLRDFNESVFKQTHDMYLLQEDDRLVELDQVTLAWWEKMMT